MKTGLFGGSFNPVHVGHLVMAQDAAEVFGLDRVVFVPCAHPPHKPAQAMESGAHRAAMIEAAAEGNPVFAVSRIELDRPGVSYTVDTLRQFRDENPEDEIYFVIGADTLPELRTWHRIGEILELCEFLTVARPGFRPGDLAPESLGLPAPWPERLLSRVAQVHEIGVSSSDIRMRLAEGLSIRYLIPESVERYIGEHHLYGL